MKTGILAPFLFVLLALSLQWNTAVVVSKPAVAVEQRTILTSRSAVDRVDAKTLAKELLTPKSFRCLSKIIAKESAWDATADNPDSSAYGVGQLLDATWKNLGMTKTDNENAQLIATLAYISRKFGSGGPCAAWSYWQQHHHY